ncbi:carboxypeptidase M32 [Thermoleophilia bacterium SCSIO 60948]|nr:carboxypeptidase M32 [Thermoleophilia bacterium SCSIO 60948]
MDERLGELRDLLGEISDLGRARALLAWDERTGMPPGGAPARAEQLATLTRVRHERLTAPRLGELLAELAEPAAELDPDGFEASLVRVATRENAKASRVPAELRARIARTSSLAETAWERAREAGDWASFRPHLERVVDLRREYAACFAPSEHPYDPLLDDFEPGMRTAELIPVLDRLRAGTIELLERIEASPIELDVSPLRGEFAVEAQWRVARRVAATMPIAPSDWRLDETVHPFLTSISPHDVRVTTRLEPDALPTSVWALIHEFGHGMYSNRLSPELERSPLARSVSLGFDESQSRMWENLVGRSRGFCAHLAPILAAEFPDRLGGLDGESLYRAANRVARTPIRMDADEVTYNLHIALRFELEVALFGGELEVADLPEAWRERSVAILGVEPRDDAEGVLQDVHWAAGSFGYFPTYSLGNVIGAQLWERIVVPELGDPEAMFARGELEPLRELMAERLYRHGGKHLPGEMIRRLTGGPLDPEPLLRALGHKFGSLYECNSWPAKNAVREPQLKLR